MPGSSITAWESEKSRIAWENEKDQHDAKKVRLQEEETRTARREEIIRQRLAALRNFSRNEK